LPTDVI